MDTLEHVKKLVKRDEPADIDALIIILEYPGGIVLKAVYEDEGEPGDDDYETTTSYHIKGPDWLLEVIVSNNTEWELDYSENENTALKWIMCPPLPIKIGYK